MNRIITIYLFILMGSTSFAQLSIKIFNYRPTGDLGFAMKPTFSGEVGYKLPFEEDENWRWSGSATFIILKPRLDTFPFTGVLSSGGSKQIVPGYISYKTYNLIQLFIGGDFAFVNKEKFHVYGGADVLFGGSTISYIEEVETIKTEDYTGGAVMIGFRLRLGAEYDLNDEITLSIHAQRSAWYNSEPESFSAANDYGLGIIYTFE